MAHPVLEWSPFCLMSRYQEKPSGNELEVQLAFKQLGERLEDIVAVCVESDCPDLIGIRNQPHPKKPAP